MDQSPWISYTRQRGMSELNTVLEAAKEYMNDAFYLLPVDQRDKVESIILQIENLKS